MGHGGAGPPNLSQREEGDLHLSHPFCTLTGSDHSGWVLSLWLGLITISRSVCPTLTLNWANRDYGGGFNEVEGRGHHRKGRSCLCPTLRVSWADCDYGRGFMEGEGRGEKTKDGWSKPKIRKII